ncbi:MAG: stage III sporulation protein AB [Clostridia bacterium]|nr:stage III sporulation protein AB [Clostridia bacterium]
MIKFFVGIAVVAFTSFCGYFFSGKYRKRIQFFAQFEEFNERFLSEISYYRRPIKQFLGKYNYKGEFSILLTEFLFSIENNEIFGVKIREEDAFHFLKKEEKEILCDYFSMLGKGDSATQKGYFSAMKEQLTRLRQEAQKEGKRYADLYVKLGFLFGLFLLILIV